MPTAEVDGEGAPRVPQHQRTEHDPEPVRIEAEILAERFAGAEHGVAAERKRGGVDGGGLFGLHLANSCESLMQAYEQGTCQFDESRVSPL